MAHFSDVVENHLGAHPLSERKRCVGAIKEMILLAGADASYALPQVCLINPTSNREFYQLLTTSASSLPSVSYG